MASAAWWVPAMALTALWLAGCAAPVAPPPPDLFRDALFGPPSQAVDADAVFAVSESMRRFIHGQVAREGRSLGRREILVQALYGRHGRGNVSQGGQAGIDHASLRLEYDAVRTRNAAEAFEARAGNCLSLVIMTAAFARELDLDVRFQAAVVDETWSRQGDLLVGAGHVNISLVGRRSDARIGFDEAPLTIDFLPQELLPGMRIRSIDPQTVLAMYMNNRAVESMTQGRLDDAYAFAREAIRRQPGFATAYNTLGVVYQRHGDLVEAGRAYAVALDHDADDPRALANIAELSVRRGLPDDAARYRQRLARLRPEMPYLAFALGQDAMRREDFGAARGYFEQEIALGNHLMAQSIAQSVAQSPTQSIVHSAAPSTADPELHFWLALADWHLGALDEAEAQLQLAQSTSLTSARQDLYGAKLTWLRSQRSRSGEAEPLR